jgi:hypothetical protein
MDRAEMELAALKKALSETTDLLATAIEREDELERAATAQAHDRKRFEQQVAEYRQERQVTKKRQPAMRKD